MRFVCVYRFLSCNKRKDGSQNQIKEQKKRRKTNFSCSAVVNNGCDATTDGSIVQVRAVQGLPRVVGDRVREQGGRGGSAAATKGREKGRRSGGSTGALLVASC